MNLMPFDEMNRLTREVRSLPLGMDGKPMLDKRKLKDDILDLLLLAYLYGDADAREALGLPAEEVEVDTREAAEIIDAEVDGKTWRERVDEHADAGDTEGIVRVIETEPHRVYNAESVNRAKALGAVYKTWHNMQDMDVRDTHWPLGEVTIGIDELFTTIAGNRAPAPGQFGVPEEDCNCRCWLTYSF